MNAHLCTLWECAKKLVIPEDPSNGFLTNHLAIAGSAEKEATQIEEGLRRRLLLLRTGAAAPDDEKQRRDERHELEQQRGLHLGGHGGAQQERRQTPNLLQEQEQEGAAAAAAPADRQVVDFLRQLRLGAEREEEGILLYCNVRLR